MVNEFIEFKANAIQELETKEENMKIIVAKYINENNKLKNKNKILSNKLNNILGDIPSF